MKNKLMSFVENKTIVSVDLATDKMCKMICGNITGTLSSCINSSNGYVYYTALAEDGFASITFREKDVNRIEKQVITVNLFKRCK